MSSLDPLSLYPMESEAVTDKTVPSPDETESEPTEFKKNQKRYQDLIATFPHVKGWRPKAPLIEYGGHWFIQPLLEGSLYAQEFFQARPTDLLVCSYPKTEFAYSPQVDALKDKENTLFSTHIPYGLLPESVVKLGCKMVYIWRDPKDTFISMWTFFHKQTPDLGSLNSLEESFDMFCQGFSGNGPYLDHVLGYWKAYQENPEHILFLKYETMRADPLPYVKRLAQFMGCGFTAEEEKKGVVEKVVNLCSFETLKNLEVNEGEKKREDVSWVYFPNSAYFRKGNVGDWHNYLTPEMAARIDGLMQSRIDGLMQDKFKGSGLFEHGKMTG